jgi:hypothetical protein
MKNIKNKDINKNQILRQVINRESKNTQIIKNRKTPKDNLLILTDPDKNKRQ